MATNVHEVSEFILDKVGGAENITSLTHCATRLRFQLADQSKADQDALDNHPAVLGVVPQGGTGLQVVMGGDVANYYKGLKELPGMGDDDAKATSGKKEYGGVRGKYAFIDYSFEFLSDTFRPILWALLGASLIITLLVLLHTFNVQDFYVPIEKQPPVFQLLHAMYQSVFYFLPIMVGACAARKLGANEWVGAAIPAAFLTPEFLAIGEKGDTVDIMGLPLVLSSYSGQVFPPLIAAIGLYWVEKGLKKIIPAAIQMVFVPFFSLLIMIPLTAFLLGPFGIGIGNGIAAAFNAVNNFSAFILALIIPVIYPFLVPLGLHWPLNAIMIQNIASNGFDVIQGPMGSWNFACFGVITGVLILSIKERNKTMRQVALGGTMAGLLGGISEPSLYGVLLRFKKSYMRLLPGCLAGGFVAGFFSIKAHAFVFTSLLTIPAMDPMLGYALSITVAFCTSLALVLLFDYRSPEEKAEILAQIAAEEGTAAADTDADANGDSLVPAGESEKLASSSDNSGGVATLSAPAKTALQASAITEITSPLEGEAVALKDVPDPIFASAKLGEGVAVKPTGKTVVTPADATILTVQKSGHAVGLRLDNGVELLVHIGIDTVQLGGEGFEVHVERKQHVTAGTPLITFDSAFIESKGYNMITPVLVTNTKKFAQVDGIPAARVDSNSVIIKTTAPTE